MQPVPGTNERTRRRVLRTLGAAGVAGLAGCSGGRGDGVGFQRDVPGETAETVTGVVPGHDQCDVTVRVRGSEFAFGWAVERDRANGVRVETDPGSVVVAAGVTDECEL